MACKATCALAVAPVARGSTGSAGMLTRQLAEMHTEDAGNRLKLTLGVSPSFSEANVGTIPRSYVPQEVRYSSSDSQEV